MLQRLITLATLIFPLIALGTGAKPALAQNLCQNYLVLPSGRQVCFDNAPVRQDATESQPSTTASPLQDRPSLSIEPGAGYTAYLDQLQTCSPYVAELPFPTEPNLLVEITIQGMQGTGCAVDVVLLEPQANTESPYLSCVYSDQTVALLTDATGYLEATQLDVGGASPDLDSATAARARAISEAVETECSVYG